jgi:cytochrome c oxidase subunit 2
MAPFRRNSRSLLAAAFVALALVGLAGCSTPQTTFEPQSDAAERIHAVYILVVVLASIVGAGVLGVMIFTLIHFRARPGRVAAQTHGNTLLEIAWTVLPVGILLIITIPSVLAWAEANRDPDPGALHITVTGHQWWWEIEYDGLGTDGSAVVTANELHLPVGQQASILLKSADVIHSFWVPKLAGKTDAVPNRDNRLEPFTPKELGVFFGQCTEFCGVAHSLMRFRVIVEPMADFEAWLLALENPAPETLPAQASQGKQLFDISCSRCHAIAGHTIQGTVGPNLSLFGERLTLGSGMMDNTDDNLKRWISDLREFKPIPDDGGISFMPSFGLSGFTERDVSDLSAYLQGLTINALAAEPVGTAP